MPMNKTIVTDLELDARGLSCPLPLLKMKLALKDLNIKNTLRVLTTDKGSIEDFKSFCELTDNKLIVINIRESDFEFVIEKG